MDRKSKKRNKTMEKGENKMIKTKIPETRKIIKMEEIPLTKRLTKFNLVSMEYVDLIKELDKIEPKTELIKEFENIKQSRTVKQRIYTWFRKYNVVGYKIIQRNKRLYILKLHNATDFEEFIKVNGDEEN